MGKQKHQNPYDYIYDTYSPEEEEQLFAAIKPSKPKVQKTIQPTFVAESAYAPDEEQIPYFNTTENSEEAILRLEENNKELAQKYLDILSSSINRQERDFIREEIKTLIRTWGLTYVDDLEHYPLSREEKHIIRMDFYGSINQTEKTPPRTNLSERYLQFINAPQTQQAELPPQDYNLDASPTWQLFRQFPRFQKIESELKEQMHKMHIPAELLPAMNAYDFSDILYNYFKEDENSPKAHLFLGARKSFIKDFIRHNENALKKYLTQINVDQRYIDALVDEMKRLGKTSNIMVMDPIKWKTLFKQYQKAGLIPTDEVYTPDVPQKYKELIKEHNDYFKVAVLDKEGKPLSGPEFSVHHKTAVKDAATIPDLADVNKFENLCLTIDSPYHRILHSLDMTQTIDKRESYKSRIYMNKDIVFWGGFHPLFHIHYDYSQDARTLRQKKNLTEWKEKHHIPTPQEIKEAYSSYVDSLNRSKNSKKEKNEKRIASNENNTPTKLGINSLPQYKKIFAEKGKQAKIKAQKIAQIVDSLYFSQLEGTRKDIPSYMRQFEGKYKDRKKKANAIGQLLGIMQAVSAIENKTQESKDNVILAAQKYEQTHQQAKRTKAMLKFATKANNTSKTETKSDVPQPKKKKKEPSPKTISKEKILQNINDSLVTIDDKKHIQFYLEDKPLKPQMKKTVKMAAATKEKNKAPQTVAPAKEQKAFIYHPKPVLNKEKSPTTNSAPEIQEKRAPLNMNRIFNKLKQKQEQKKLEQQKHNYRYQMKRKKIEAIKELYRIMQQVAAKPDRTKEQDSRAMERILFVLSQNKSRS